MYSCAIYPLSAYVSSLLAGELSVWTQSWSVLPPSGRAAGERGRCSRGGGHADAIDGDLETVNLILVALK